ncbi:PREDICTED: uncharacterized protein LOC105565392 isoform X3 [Vollenhovia emeryi]|uniref:uncharacterized protein LOC105565392 isoform X3 n=1 Tax=Vollenhovia emeryi TaxID=411798 RepID=UPI0005F52DA2|nr:PREDICTED: uncharacterized protein LOC105565392 isoform X3 [Vollenhovia emeryi]
MDFAGERYYNLNRILLLSLGLWPDQISTFKKVQNIFYQTLFISFLTCQCIPLFIKQYSIIYICQMLSHIVITGIFILVYNTCLLLSDNIKYIFDRVRYDWNMLQAHAELEILRKYANEAKFHTVLAILVCTSIGLGLLIICWFPRILDVFPPMNASRPRQILINLEYFVDEETYFFAILMHMVLTIYAGCMTVVAIATVFLIFISHICALFKIASYNMEHIFDKNVQLMPKDIKQSILYNNLIHAVYVHRRAMDFSLFYIVLLVFSVASMSLSFYNVLNAVTSLVKVDLFMNSSMILAQLYCIFMGNYAGQNIIDSSSGISQATYNAQWYAAPLCMQKLILLIIQKSNKHSALTIGVLFNVSLEGFAKVLSTCISYVMVFQSVETNKESGKK